MSWSVSLRVRAALRCGALLVVFVACVSGGTAHADAGLEVASSCGCLAAAPPAGAPAANTCRRTQRYFGRIDGTPAFSRTTNRTGSNLLGNIGGVLNFRFDASAPNPAFLIAAESQTERLARVRTSYDPTSMAVIGTASTYNPLAPDADDPDGLETASGELYDDAAWTAAIRIDLRALFGGVGGGTTYVPAYAAVESGDKRIVVKINDVGPLAPGRVIDLGHRVMQYLDPSLELGLLDDVRVTPLPGTDWTAGPFVNGDKIVMAGDLSP